MENKIDEILASGEAKEVCVIGYAEEDSFGYDQVISLDGGPRRRVDGSGVKGPVDLFPVPICYRLKENGNVASYFKEDKNE